MCIKDISSFFLRNSEFLNEKLDNGCYFKCYNTKEFKSLLNVFHVSSERISDMSKPWYVGWNVCHDSIFRELSKLVFLPRFLSTYKAVGNMSIFIGTPGNGASRLGNVRDLPTWHAQVSGSQTWYLKPPPECTGSCPSLIQTDLDPGDMIIFNTNFWTHSTKVLDNGISLVVSRQFD